MISGLGGAALVAAGAYASTNIDNLTLTAALVAATRPDRVRRVIRGQVAGQLVVVVVSIAAAAVLFAVPARWIGLLGFVPIALGLRGLVTMRSAIAADRAARPSAGADPDAGADPGTGAGGDGASPEPNRGWRTARRLPAAGFFTALLTDLGASGDNFSVYIPIFRTVHVAGGLVTLAVFALLEVVLCALAVFAGRHPHTRRVLDRGGLLAIPFLYLAIGVVVLIRSGVFS